MKKFYLMAVAAITVTLASLPGFCEVPALSWGTGGLTDLSTGLNSAIGGVLPTVAVIMAIVLGVKFGIKLLKGAAR